MTLPPPMPGDRLMRTLKLARFATLTLLHAAALGLSVPMALAQIPDYLLLKRCTATMDERPPLNQGQWQIGVPLVSIQLANGTGGWLARHTFEFDTYAFCNGPNRYPEYGTGDDICMGRAADLPGTLVYSTTTQAPDAASGTFSLTDSPSGNYPANTTSRATINPSFNLSGYLAVKLIYFHHQALIWDQVGDVGFVEVSTNGGANWVPLRAHSHYLGDKGQFKRAEINLTPFIGQTINIRFRLTTNVSFVDDGWYVDDVRLLADGTTLFFDDFESGTSNWTLVGWGLSLPNYTFQNLGSIDANGVYSTTPVTNPVSVGEGMGFAAVRAAYTQGMTTRLVHAQVHHTGPQFRPATELGYDNLCPSTGTCVTAAVEDHPAPQMRVILEPNHPNPFNPSTDIRFRLPEASPVSLRIYDQAGRLVRTLLEEAALPAGEHRLSWNGLDAGGQEVRSGVYFYELRVNGREHTRKMVLLK
jgi:hypothetical protein